MKTEFSARQLGDPELYRIDKILRHCVHCGFCNATCPTYLLKGDELDGPRGRIYLLKDMLEKQTAPGREVVKHLDRCLSCLSCVSTCPSGVDYMHLIDHGRAYIEKHHNRILADKLLRGLLACILPNPNRFRWFLQLSSWARPLARFLPPSLQAALRLARQNSRICHEITEKIYYADGETRGRVALLPGCAQQVAANEINMASIRLLNRMGFDVHLLADTACCAAIEHHLGKTGPALDRIKANLRRWSTALPGLDALISNASGCGTMMKDYAHLLRQDRELSGIATEASNKTKDICEFLAQQDYHILHNTHTGGQTVAYQNPCSMQHAQKIHQEPLRLLQAFGYQTTTVPQAHLCCGSAGTYNILQPALAANLGQQKAESIASTKPDLIASGNLGCILQLRQYSEQPIVHTVQLLDWASGGPKPSEIK